MNEKVDALHPVDFSYLLSFNYFHLINIHMGDTVHT